MPPRLPPEVFNNVIDKLDPNTERATILSLLHVSKAVSYMATEVLYRNLDISGNKICTLLLSSGAKRHDKECRARQTIDPSRPFERGECHPGCIPDASMSNPDPSPRTRHALSRIRRLSLRDLKTSHVRKMLAATIPTVVLFPGVTELHIYSTKYTKPEDKSCDLHTYPRTKLFDAVHLCAWEYAPASIATNLTVKRYHSLNLHARFMDMTSADHFSYRHNAWDRSSRQNWFVNVHRGYGLPLHRRCNRYVPPARCLVGRSTVLAIPHGDWTAANTTNHEFRIDAAEHAPCVVCGGKMEFAARQFGATFTSSW
ncbi:hypothetical protein Q8F55_000581 [Vanrija albida]|uniref:F-box domain-containing protein n=1 Tax=Vanrija albida TaxID=181172 RepID=A0ABR3QE74_9TREE